ncbi:MAG: zinc-binding dehydrogenase [Actinomycetota bacterium]|nr:zinc-binding dehydrogenase [Actinomycetota bacterium]
MQTGLLTSKGVMEIVEVTTPSVTGPGQVLVRNLVSTICGSDVHVVFDSPVTDAHRPGYPGHESVGVVVESSDPAFAEDDLVLAVPNLLHAGGFAPYQLLPSSLVIPLPRGTDPATAVLAQQLGTTIFGMKRFWPGPGEGTAVVLGAGPVGLCFTWLCRSAGFENVVVSDLHPHRLEVATAMGATVGVLAAGDAVVDAVHEVAAEGARLVVEAAGKDATRVRAVHCVAVNGHRHVRDAGGRGDDRSARDPVPPEADGRVLLGRPGGAGTPLVPGGVGGDPDGADRPDAAPAAALPAGGAAGGPRGGADRRPGTREVRRPVRLTELAPTGSLSLPFNP